MAISVIDYNHCTGCGACAANCPVDCITEGDGKYVIDQDKCVQCGTGQMNCPADGVTREG